MRHYAEDFPTALAPGLRLQPVAAAESARGQEGRKKKVVLITGGGTGIGRAVALRLAQGGWQGDGDAAVVLVLTGRRAAPLEETAEVARAAGAAEVLAWPADLTREAEVLSLVGAIERRYGRIDLLFNNAGTNVPPTPFGEMELKDWRHVVDTNLTAAFHVAREAYRLMARQQPQGGRIINNGSVSAQVPRPGACAYTAAKCGLTGLTKSIALDGRAVGVACGQIDYGNVRCPPPPAAPEIAHHHPTTAPPLFRHPPLPRTSPQSPHPYSASPHPSLHGAGGLRNLRRHGHRHAAGGRLVTRRASDGCDRRGRRRLRMLNAPSWQHHSALPWPPGAGTAGRGWRPAIWGRGRAAQSPLRARGRGTRLPAPAKVAGWCGK